MEKVSKRTEVSVHGIDLMISLITSKYPLEKRDSYDKLAALINKEFNTCITEDQLVDFTAVGREIEDRELIYKHCV